MKTLQYRILLAFGTLALLFASMPTSIAHAATFTVTKTADTDDGICNSDCSLREAISAAYLTLGDDTIILPAGIYTLSIPGDLNIYRNVTVYGAGALSAIVDQNAVARIVVYGATVNFYDVTIRNGTTGIYNSGGVLTLNNSIVSGNNSGGFGAGILNIDGTVVINSSAIISNTANIDFAGGISNSTGGTLTINNSTISGNRAMSAAGIWNFGTVNLNNVTISGNVAANGGGGIVNHGTVDFKNTIIAGNIDNNPTAKQPDCSGTLNSQGYNLIQDTSGCTISGTTTGNLLSVDPRCLGLLQNNSGNTFTHALLQGSQAIDAGNPATPGSGGSACAATDQRGIVRPPGPRCDIRA